MTALNAHVAGDPDDDTDTGPLPLRSGRPN